MDISAAYGQGFTVNVVVDHLWADLDFLGVLVPPFFLGVLKSLSQTSHTQRPEEYTEWIRNYSRDPQK